MRALGLIAIAAFAGALACAMPASVLRAQPPAPAEAKLEWTRVNGTAVELGISANGIVFAADRDYNLWRWEGDVGKSWRLLPMRIGRVAPGPQGKPWAIATDGRVYEYNGLWWETRGDIIANDIGVGGKKGEVFALTRAGALVRWQDKDGTWQNLGGSELRRLAVDDVGRPWTINQKGSIVRYENGGFTDLPGRARDIAVSPEGVAFIVADDGTVARWSAKTEAWDTLPDVKDAAFIAAGPNARPWIATVDGRIYATSDFKPPAGKGPAPGQISAERRQQIVAAEIATVTDNSPFNFVLVRGAGGDIAIGRDGSVFITDPEGQVMRWSNAERVFQRFTGGGNRIAVTPAGLPWSVTSQGQVYRHDGKSWVQVLNISDARDITIGGDGSVFVVNTAAALLKFDTERNQFVDTRIGRVVSAGVTPQGQPWIVRDDGALMRCDSIPCRRVGPPRVLQRIDIGPDGSIFVIDSVSVLWRYSRDQDTLERIRGEVAGAGVAEVAVGPRGRPWIIDTARRIYATTFFGRDETQDSALSQRTSQMTAPAEPAVVFGRHLRFRQVSSPGATPFQIQVGRDGSVYLWDVALHILRLNTRTRQFEPKIGETGTAGTGCSPSFPSTFRRFAAANANEIWQIGLVGASCNVVRRTTGASPSDALRKCEIKFEQPSPPNPMCTTEGLSIVIGADGSVFYVDKNRLLYRFMKNTDRFQLFSSSPILTNVKAVAVDPKGQPWIIDWNNRVRQFDGRSFVDRPRSGLAQRADLISIGANGSVYIVDLNGFLYRYNATNDAFDRINGMTGVFDLAVGPDGLPWVITTAGKVMHAQR